MRRLCGAGVPKLELTVSRKGIIGGSAHELARRTISNDPRRSTATGGVQGTAGTGVSGGSSGAAGTTDTGSSGCGCSVATSNGTLTSLFLLTFALGARERRGAEPPPVLSSLPEGSGSARETPSGSRVSRSGSVGESRARVSVVSPLFPGRPRRAVGTTKVGEIIGIAVGEPPAFAVRHRCC